MGGKLQRRKTREVHKLSGWRICGGGGGWRVCDSKATRQMSTLVLWCFPSLFIIQRKFRCMKKKKGRTPIALQNVTFYPVASNVKLKQTKLSIPLCSTCTWNRKFLDPPKHCVLPTFRASKAELEMTAVLLPPSGVSSSMCSSLSSSSVRCRSNSFTLFCSFSTSPMSISC